jgi:hypothetical protein
MTTQLVLRDQSDDLILQDIENTQKLCASLMKTPHYAKMGEVGIFAVVQKARSVGMNPLDALNGGMYFVQGKVEMSGQAMLAVIRAHGHSVSMDLKSTDTKVIMHGRRKDNGDTWTAEYSVDDAKRAGIYRNQWEKMPRTMCKWRCVSELGRFLFSDILKGVYVQGEISESVPFNAPVNVDISTGEVLEEKIQRLVTKEQVFEFEDILSGCCEEDQKKAKEYLIKQGFSEYGELPIKAFEILKERAIAKRDEYQASLKKEVKEDLFQEVM